MTPMEARAKIRIYETYPGSGATRMEERALWLRIVTVIRIGRKPEMEPARDPVLSVQACL